MILNIIKPALFACYSLFLLMSFSAFGYSSVDEHYVFYLTKKDGGHTGHTVWYGTIGERKSSKNELVVFLKDKHQADSVTIAPVYPGYCGVLYSRQKKNGRTQYSLSTNRTMADAQKEAKEKRQNTYTDYDVHEVICSPKSCIQLNESPESCLAINTGTDTIEASLFCASGETKKYTIRKLNTKRKIFLVKSGYSQGVLRLRVNNQLM